MQSIQQAINDNKENLKSFIQNLTSDQLALESLQTLKNKIHISNLEILEISKNRLSNKYQSIKDTLDINLNDAITTTAIVELTREFDYDIFQDNIKLSDIFSYYDVQNKHAEFVSLLNTTVISEIANNFSTSEDKVYISTKEFEKLEILIPNLNLPKVEILSNYLNKTVKPIIESITLNEETINNFDFGNSKILNDESTQEENKEEGVLIESKEPEETNRREILTNKFKELLKEQNPTEQQVSSFFQEALMLETEINQDNQSKLTDFFKSNKNILAILFSKDEGLDKFILSITSLGDGCVANIATQAKIALYQSLLENSPTNQILFSIFNEKISTPILNSGGDHLTGSSTGIDIFNDSFISQNYLSLNGLVKVISEEFYKENKVIKSSSEFIRGKLGDETSYKILDIILEEQPEKYENKAAEIASYLILKEKFPELLESKYLIKLKDNVEAILNEAQKQVIEKQEQERSQETRAPNPTTSKPNAEQVEHVEKERGS